jgi:hypothetical protein
MIVFRKVIKILVKMMLKCESFKHSPFVKTPNSEKLVDFLVLDLLVLALQLLLIEFIEVKIACVLLRVPVLPAEDILAAALHAGQSDLLLACPAPILLLLQRAIDWLLKFRGRRTFGQHLNLSELT